MRASQVVADVGERSLKVRWSGAGTRETGPQPLTLIHATCVDLPCVIVLADIGAALDRSQDEALHLGGILTFGAVMARGGRFALRVSALLGSLQVAELETVLGYTAATGVALRRQAARPAIDAGLCWVQD
ncbi:MAG: hypothetical protein K8W52_12225 [Deltaproteobacteria bacterium]|nr:hypothetical protein [Deltaproteobacteria bacterium]